MQRSSSGIRGRLAAAAVLALTVAACGGAETAEPAPAPAPAPEAPEAPAEPAAEEYPLEGELITLLVGTSPGGGFDSYARLVAPFLAEELKADVTVTNLEGAGGLIQLNTLWSAEPDGTTIGIVNGSGVVGSVLGGASGIEFALDEFSWLGRIAGEARVLTVNAGSEFESAAQMVGSDRPFRFSATGPGGGTYNDAVLTCAAFEMTDCEVVTGFGGSSEARLAVTAGEVTGVMTTADSVLGDIANGDHRALGLLSTVELPDFPGVPVYAEIEGLSEDGVRIANAMVAIIEAGRSFAAPPNMPEPIIAELRRAFEAVVTSPEFLAEAAVQERPIGYLPPDEYLSIVQTALGAPQIVKDILAEGIE